MNTSLIVRLFAAVGVCVGLAQAAVAHDPNAARTNGVLDLGSLYRFGTRIAESSASGRSRSADAPANNSSGCMRAVYSAPAVDLLLLP